MRLIELGFRRHQLLRQADPKTKLEAQPLITDGLKAKDYGLI